MEPAGLVQATNIRKVHGEYNWKLSDLMIDKTQSINQTLLLSNHWDFVISVDYCEAFCFHERYKEYITQGHNELKRLEINSYKAHKCLQNRTNV